ncbi:MAG: diguanylate cyclase [Bacteroidales bacterium]|jgi:transcriptional regulator with PAS, ATPase and Fis domain|nr:diguanylate cyclase [Bacteroidales bacterium]
MDSKFNELPFMAITVADKDGEIIDMNERSANTFENSGGKALIGKKLLDCHPEKARNIIKSLAEEQKTNVYTIEKNGVKKLIYQTPCFKNGVFDGLIEFSIIIPEDIPHYVRN